MKQLLGDLLGAVNFDASFFRTMGPFLFKPGFLAREYLEGRRKKYMSPVRLYLFLSILFFFVARISTNQSAANIDPSVLSVTQDSVVAALEEDSLLHEQIPLDTIGFRDLQRIVSDDTIPSAQEKQFAEGIQRTLDDPARFMNEILEIISYALFLLMPLFAAILMLLYIRRKRYYIEHLLFALNMHSFALLVLTLLVVLQLILGERYDFIIVLILLIPLYLIIGMKRFYGQGIPKVLLKSILLAMLYGVLLVITLILILYMAMFWL